MMQLSLLTPPPPQARKPRQRRAYVIQGQESAAELTERYNELVQLTVPSDSDGLGCAWNAVVETQPAEMSA